MKKQKKIHHILQSGEEAKEIKHSMYLLGKCKVLCVDEKTILLPMCDEIFCSIKITAAMN